MFASGLALTDLHLDTQVLLIPKQPILMVKPISKSKWLSKKLLSFRRSVNFARFGRFHNIFLAYYERS